MTNDNLHTFDFYSDYRDFVSTQLANANVRESFDRQLRGLRRADLVPEPFAGRLDLREEPCLTIDCADTKDMDDAVSVARTAGGYLLGVHIADVAAYVTPGSALDACAMERGTSHYLPDRTIPMLPPVLSDDLCSLNPGQDRNAVSVLVDLDCDGNVTGYDVTKSLIRSRVKGVYEEVDAILSYEADGLLCEKYSCVADSLPAMAELAQKLRRARAERGARIDGERTGKVVVDEEGVSVRVRERGLAETIVEELMVLANSLVADYLVANGLPGIFRTQGAHGTFAEYRTRCDRHADLELARYAHFTSPIRRLSDLKVHQVISAHLKGCPVEAMHYLFDGMVEAASDVAQRRSRTAYGIERACEKRALAYYYQTRSHHSFTGTVCGTARDGRPLVLVDETASLVELQSRMRVGRGQRLSFGVVGSSDSKLTLAINARRLPRAA